jgi:hypothetical protein
MLLGSAKEVCEALRSNLDKHYKGEW